MADTILAGNDEKNLPTEQSTAKADSRLSCAHGLSRRAQRAQAPAREGTPTPDGFGSAEAAGLDNRFGRGNRLRRRAEFLAVQSSGARYQTPHFVVYAARLPAQSGNGEARLGITVSKRVGNAVARNRVKRRVRETFRLSLKHLMAPGLAMVVIARDGADRVESPTINAELRTATLSLMQRLRD